MTSVSLFDVVIRRLYFIADAPCGHQAVMRGHNNFVNRPLIRAERSGCSGGSLLDIRTTWIPDFLMVCAGGNVDDESRVQQEEIDEWKKCLQNTINAFDVYSMFWKANRVIHKPHVNASILRLLSTVYRFIFHMALFPLFFWGEYI